jgi:hypothetical protein
MSRLDDVRALLELSEPLDAIKKRLAAYPWDYDGEAIPLQRSHFASVFERFLAGELDAGAVEDWAEAIECREDVDDNYRRDTWVNDALFWLANPYMNGEINRGSVESALARLNRPRLWEDKRFPVDDDRTEEDFAYMSWRDASVYFLSPPDEGGEIAFLIDYIFHREEKPDGTGWYYWVSPCFLKFSNVLDLRIDLDFRNTTGLSIVDIKHVGDVPRADGKGKSLLLSVDCDHGTISFSCTGFVQVSLKPAARSETMSFGSWTGE